jgi:hypothetical protein
MKKSLAKLAYRVLLPEIKAIESESVKRKWLQNCVFAFQLEGKNYYRYATATELPLSRYERMQVLLLQLENRITEKELSTLIEVGMKAAETAVSSFKTKNKIEGLENIYYVFREMKSRQTDLMFHPEIIMELAALVTIQEGEDVTVFDEDLHKEKVRLFTQHGGTADFFTRLGVNTLLPNVEQLQTKFIELWELHKKQIQRSNQTFDTILTEINATHG